MDHTEIEALIRLLEASNLTEIEVEEDGRRIRLQRSPAGYAPAPMPAAAPAPQAPAEGEPAEDDGLEGLATIDSPMVGTFYAAPAPGEAPFVKAGDRVDESATVCIVEAMKLMNEVVAKFACIIERVLVENGQPVEFGQPLFAVRPV